VKRTVARIAEGNRSRMYAKTKSDGTRRIDRFATEWAMGNDPGLERPHREPPERDPEIEGDQVSCAQDDRRLAVRVIVTTRRHNGAT
jgi:hypothetical protein